MGMVLMGVGGFRCRLDPVSLMGQKAAEERDREGEEILVFLMLGCEYTTNDYGPTPHQLMRGPEEELIIIEN